MRLFERAAVHGTLIWVAVSFASTVHLYWAAVRLPAAFSGRELYLAAIGVGYVLDLLWWRLLHVTFTCMGIHRALDSGMQLKGVLVCNAGLPPLADYLLSYDLTLEVYLAGVFVGVVIFHSRCYGNGFTRIGSSKFVYSIGVLFPTVISLVGSYGQVQSLLAYTLYWLTGIVAGLVRGVGVHVLVCKRLPLWWQVGMGQNIFQFQETIIINYEWMTRTFGTAVVERMVHKYQRRQIRIGKFEDKK